MSTSVLPPAMDEPGPSTSALNGLTPLSELVQRSVKRSRAVYAGQQDGTDGLDKATRIKLSTKLAAEFKDVQTLPPVLASQHTGPAGPQRPAAPAGAGPNVKLIGGPEAPSRSAAPWASAIKLTNCRSSTSASGPGPASEPRSLVKFRHQQGFAAEGGHSGSRLSQALMRKKEAREVKPAYHAQCKLTPLRREHSSCKGREAHTGHLGTHGMGPRSVRRSGQSVVRHGGWGPSRQGQLPRSR